jgi:hypothetical protein
MRKEKALTDLLRELVRIVADEYERNSAFAQRLDRLLDAVPLSPSDKGGRSGARSTSIAAAIPDVYSELRARSEPEFRLWLQRVPIAVLREIIRSHDLDATRRTSKWRDAEKLANHIADQLVAGLLIHAKRQQRRTAYQRGCGDSIRSERSK